MIYGVILITFAFVPLWNKIETRMPFLGQKGTAHLDLGLRIADFTGHCRQFSVISTHGFLPEQSRP